jgi:hypothetical protein
MHEPIHPKSIVDSHFRQDENAHGIACAAYFKTHVLSTCAAAYFKTQGERASLFKING